jgi:hypothetical protein
LLDALLGQQAQEGGLLELRGKTLAKGIVKDGIASFIREIRENDGVHLGQCGNAARIVEPASKSKERDNDCGSGCYRLPTEASRGNRCGGYRGCC